jgi:hypothetical protein
MKTTDEKDCTELRRSDGILPKTQLDVSQSSISCTKFFRSDERVIVVWAIGVGAKNFSPQQRMGLGGVEDRSATAVLKRKFDVIKGYNFHYRRSATVGSLSPKVFIMDNPLQAEGAARGIGEGAARGNEIGGIIVNHTNHINHKNHSSDNIKTNYINELNKIIYV